MADLFLHLLNMSITAGWLVLAVVVLRLLLKKAPKAISCLLWAFVAIRLLLPFSIESVLSLIPSTETVPPDIIYAQQPTIHTGIPSFNAAINPIITDTFAPEGMGSINPIQVALFIAAWIWVLGAAGMLVYAGVSYLRIRKKVSAAVRQGSCVYLCDYVDSPFILGFIRPRIYLPSTLSEAAMTHVLAHEEAHLARKDHWWKPLGYLLLAIYWFNPLMWLAYILLCRDIELACDEKVIKTMSGAEKQAYSTALLGCSIRRTAIAACPLAFGEVGVKTRIKSVLSYKKPAFWIILVAVIASIAVAVCFLTDPKDSSGTQEDSYSFRATIEGVEGNVLLVQPKDETLPTYVHVVVDKDTASQFQPGDYVLITYDGTLAETYPPQILKPYSVRAYAEVSGPPAANSHGVYLVGDLLAQSSVLSYAPRGGNARILLTSGHLQYNWLTGERQYSGDTYIACTYNRSEFEQLLADAISDPTVYQHILPWVPGDWLQTLLGNFDPEHIAIHRYYDPASSAHIYYNSYTVFYFDGIPTWFCDRGRLYLLEAAQPETSYTIISGSRSIPAVAFPENTRLKDLENQLYALELSLNPDATTPFDVLLDGEYQYGSFGIYDAETFESLDFFRPSGLDPQTYLLQNAQYGKSYIVSMKTGEQTLYWKIKLPEEDDWGITLAAQDVSPTGMTLICTQNGGCPKDYIMTGEPFWLEQLSVGWHEVPHDQLYTFRTVAYRVPMGDTTRWQIDWSDYYTLSPGTYRICKNFSVGDESQTFYAEFTIQ